MRRGTPLAGAGLRWWSAHAAAELVAPSIADSRSAPSADYSAAPRPAPRSRPVNGVPRPVNGVPRPVYGAQWLSAKRTGANLEESPRRKIVHAIQMP
jgi:hypothetical protein